MYIVSVNLIIHDYTSKCFCFQRNTYHTYMINFYVHVCCFYSNLCKPLYLLVEVHVVLNFFQSMHISGIQYEHAQTRTGHQHYDLSHQQIAPTAYPVAVETTCIDKKAQLCQSCIGLHLSRPRDLAAAPPAGFASGCN